MGVSLQGRWIGSPTGSGRSTKGNENERVRGRFRHRCHRFSGDVGVAGQGGSTQFRLRWCQGGSRKNDLRRRRARRSRFASCQRFRASACPRQRRPGPRAQGLTTHLEGANAEMRPDRRSAWLRIERLYQADRPFLDQSHAAVLRQELGLFLSAPPRACRL